MRPCICKCGRCSNLKHPNTRDFFLVTGGSSRSTFHGTLICHPLRNQFPDPELWLKWKKDPTLQDDTMCEYCNNRWEWFLYRCDCDKLLCTYCIHVKKSRVERATGPTLGGPFMRLISTKLSKKKLFIRATPFKLTEITCIYHAYCTHYVGCTFSQIDISTHHN